MVDTPFFVSSILDPRFWFRTQGQNYSNRDSQITAINFQITAIESQTTAIEFEITAIDFGSFPCILQAYLVFVIQNDSNKLQQ